MRIAVAVLVAGCALAAEKALTTEQRLERAKAILAVARAENSLHRVHAEARAAVERGEEALRKSIAAYESILERLRKDAGVAKECLLRDDDTWDCGGEKKGGTGK